MYAVSEKYRERVYSGGALHRASLTINGEVIPNSSIKKITVSSPLIDTTTDYFYIGAFVAQKIEIQFKNANNIDLNGTVVLSIETKVREASGSIETEDYDDGYEIVPIGVFLIDTTPEDYYKNAKITCYDKSILFKNNIDISQWFDEDGKITAENLLKALCSHFLGETMLGTYPETNKDITTGFYDSTKSGKWYISHIAEIMGGNAKIGRDGKLYIVPIKQSPAVTINAKKSKSWTLKSYYKVSRVYFEDLNRKYEFGTEENNSLNIRSENIFVNGNDANGETVIENIYNELNGFEFYAIKNENYGDPSLDCWDIIAFQLDNQTYNAFNENTLTYEMNIATTIENTIPSKQKQEITNVKKAENERINRIENEVDSINGKVTTTITRVGDVEHELSENTYSKTEVNKLIQDAENGLTNIFTKSGGNNLLTNTAPYRIISDTELENWVGNIGAIDETNSITKSALKLLNGVASQRVEVPVGIYSVGFKYKRLLEGATLKISYNGREINIDNEDNVTYNNENNLTNNGIEITSFGEVTNTTFTISFECNADGGFEIYELRLVYGDLALPWSQNQNELKTKSVNIGDGITIDSEQADTINYLDTDGMRVYSKTQNDYSLKTTDEGIETNDLTSKGKSNISGMLVQRINKKHIFITGIVEE